MVVRILSLDLPCPVFICVVVNNPNLKNNILNIEQITRQFSAQGSAAVDHLSLTLQEGELLSLLGPSGCGKTTLLRLIAGFERPQSGRITLNGEEIACPQCHWPPEHRKIGMVFQDYALFPHLTVAQNIAFGLHRLGNAQTCQTPSASRWSQAPVQPKGAGQAGRPFWNRILPRFGHLSPPMRERIATLVELVNLQGLEHRYPHQLSGGQQQRVALARALAPQPQLILLDEPLSNLDIQVRSYLRQELRQILKAAGTSAILVTHDQEEALSISDRIAVMRNGRIEQLDTPDRVYNYPQTRFVAEFVTQANFIPAQYQSGGWKTDIGWLTDDVSDAVKVIPQGADSPVDLMVRQEDCRLNLDPRGNALVESEEFLGREQRFYLRLDSGQTLRIRQSSLPTCRAGSRVSLCFQPDFKPWWFPPFASQHIDTAPLQSPQSLEPCYQSLKMR